MPIWLSILSSLISSVPPSRSLDCDEQAYKDSQRQTRQGVSPNSTNHTAYDNRLSSGYVSGTSNHITCLPLVLEFIKVKTSNNNVNEASTANKLNDWTRTTVISTRTYRYTQGHTGTLQDTQVHTRTYRYTHVHAMKSVGTLIYKHTVVHKNKPLSVKNMPLYSCPELQ